MKGFPSISFLAYSFLPRHNTYRRGIKDCYNGSPDFPVLLFDIQDILRFQNLGQSFRFNVKSNNIIKKL